MDEETVIKERTKKFGDLLKKNYRILSYLGLAVITFISVYIRTRNLPGLRDITTGGWTLGPDLDPFLFLRWAKYIVVHGSIMAVDSMRYVPLGYETRGELLLTPYFIAWFHKIAVIFGSVSVEQSAVLYPVFMFALTVIAFFFLSRKILAERVGEGYANLGALIAAFFLSVLPSLLPRTIAGIPEKEAGAFLFMFLSFYLLLSAWKARGKIGTYTLAILAGLSTGIMALIWGGFTFVYLTIAPAVFIAFIIGKVGKKEILVYSLWVLSSFAFMYPSSSRYNLHELLTSIDTGAAVAVLLIILFHEFVFSSRFAAGIRERIYSGRLKNVPSQVLSTIIGGVILIVLASAIFGIGFVPSKLNAIWVNLITPSANRLLLTVAENKQPYFSEWAGNFGPYVGGMPITFWLFLVAAIYMFYKAMKPLHKRDRMTITGAFTIFLLALIFSRYSADSLLNGTNFVSKFVYGFGFLFFVACCGFYLYKYHKNSQQEILKEIDFGFILMCTFFLLSVIAARAAVRTIMVLVPAVAILIGYIVVASIIESRAVDNKSKKIVAFTISAAIILSVLFSGYQFYKATKGGAETYYPGPYNQQWQKAMAWVRTNTPESSVFGHWWDYGYWVQSIGERATVLDGGNAISYWNHMMGRYALTGSNRTEALEFLYAHNVTHFLIDSSDIGKYPAYASIGSDASYDRLSSISTFYRDPQQVQERKNSTISLYVGGIGVDEDMIYMQNETRIFIPKNKAGIGGVLIERDNEGRVISAPQALFVYNNNQYNIPIKYAYTKDGVEIFNEGIEAGVFVYPRVVASGNSAQIDGAGALLYLSNKTIHSQFARLYLFGEQDSNFVLVHSEDDFIVADVKNQGVGFGDFLDYGGVRGPIKIWEVHYPAGIEYKEKYLKRDYPAELLNSG